MNSSTPLEEAAALLIQSCQCLTRDEALKRLLRALAPKLIEGRRGTTSRADPRNLVYVFRADAKR